MKIKSNVVSKIFTLIFFIIIVVVLCGLYNVYKTNYANEFGKAEYYPYKSSFKRDKDVKYSDSYSYKIESNDYNDAMYYLDLDVEKNTSYRITCMVKTKDVEPENEKSHAGAMISLSDTVYTSKAITGTTDWQKLELMFNSKNNDKVTVGFRLGGNEKNCKGTAWFSDFKIEKGIKKDDTNWNMVCFLIKNVSIVDQNGEKFNISMTDSDIQSMKDNMERLKSACYQLSGNNMTIGYETIEIDEPLTTISYDNEHGYYVAPIDVEKLIDKYVQNGEYDHIFIAVRFGDLAREITVHDWIGLGGMDYYGIGFSNIRLPSDSKSYVYKYNTHVNTFPEEVFLHEFLHTLERILNEGGYDIPALHDNEKYGYKNQALIGLKNWYAAYMTCNIVDKTGKDIGLDSAVYSMKPAQRSDFNNSRVEDLIVEPKNFIEEVQSIIKTITKRVTRN